MPHVTANALQKILEGIVEQGMPELRTRNQMREATRLLMNEVTPFGQLIVEIQLDMVDGTTLTDYAVNPYAFLFHAYKEDGPFRKVLDQAIPGDHSHMRLVVYADEVVPGKELSHNNKRKQWCMYWSLGELLPYFHLEETWIPILAIRSATVDKVSAGISQVMAQALLLFFGDLGHDASQCGISLIGGDGVHTRLFIKLWMVVQDGGAHKLLWHCKGDGGTKMCMLCKCLIAADTGEKDEDDIPIIVCNELGAPLDVCTDADIRGTIDRLSAKRATLNIGKFKLYQQAVGYNDEPHGILRNERIREHVHPASQYCHDWMHALMVSGVMNVVLYLLLLALSRLPQLGNWYEQVYTYLSMWEWPSFKDPGKAARDLFLKKRETANRKAKIFKALASELLAVYPIIALFLTRVIIPSGACVDECAAFLALADLVDLLLVVNLGKVAPSELEAASDAFIQACKDAGWTGRFIPKFHWIEHFASHLDTFGCMPTCWVHERKHRVAKRYAADIANTTDMERSLLGELVSHNLFDINRAGLFDLSPGIVRPMKAHHAIVKFVQEHINADATSNDVKKGFKAKIIPAGFACRNDVALVRSAHSENFICGRILVHLEVMGESLTLLEQWASTAYDNCAGYADWTMGGDILVFPTRYILSPLCHCDLGGNASRTLIPWLYRKYKPVDN